MGPLDLNKIFGTKNLANIFTKVVIIEKFKLCMASTGLLGTQREGLNQKRGLQTSRLDGSRFFHHPPSMIL